MELVIERWKARKKCFFLCLFPGDVLEEEDAFVKSKEMQVEKLPTGHVVGIIRRKWRQYCGILQQNQIKGVSSVG
jgi:exoribonuclease R